MKATADEILPASSGPFTKAVSFAASDDLPVPLRAILGSATSPMDWLPFLAAHESVDLWFDDWSADRKRQMIAEAAELAALVGTRAALDRFLPFVDASIIDRISHPRRFVVGFSAIGLDPIGHKPFTAHLLVKVPLRFPSGAFVVGRSALRRDALRTVDREPIRRVRRAVQAAKAPETLITINHGHRRPVTIDDGFPLDGSFRFGDFRDRKRL
ncbi:phage tail protein I [Terrihabitans rhizophilus]|uniref:Phage tail protein I n=1 Tax=Terrihabitans rhizophilus TaxID=3092662 RepID=A0ABU4RU04_9HYPH|nr:phage tail protein I [Terrihabitans sp. PJ23]MDX6806311.1 phage tail protein I [Terrihabitans sp. PJ23]